MKKVFKVFALLLVVALTVCMFTACSKKLSGSYSDSLGITTYAFDGSDVKLTINGGIFKDIVLEGTYEISEDEEGKEIITFVFPSDEEDAEDYSGTHTFVEGKEGDVEYIKIDGAKYNKNAE